MTGGTEPVAAQRIGTTVADSEPRFLRRPRARGPNVVTIVLDDVGFAQLGCCGASIATPHLDALAAEGALLTGFHVAALCSPTRASLLTGRHHHAVGMGFLAAFDTGFPGYRAAVTPRAATLAEMLRPHGYGTYAAGKWHLTPPQDLTPAGPFDQWPTGRGFSRYYGFLWGEDDQYAPELWHDQHRVPVPDRPGYHLSEDLVDRSIGFLADHVTARPDDPFCLYLAFGACHAPHQAPAAYADRYRGAFDHGWDAERERVLERQVAAGLLPPGTRLCARNPGVPAWDDLDADRRRVYARMQEVFAGFLTHTDAQVGRLVGWLRERGRLDDTVLLVLSDNGASGEGGPHGTANEYRYFLGLEDSLDDAVAALDRLGGPHAHNHYPQGWAQAGNTPFRMYKKHTYGGGVRVPMVVRAPGRVPAGVVRDGFAHVTDVVPTLLELAGVVAPTTYAGVPQLPLHGVSLLPLLTGATPPVREATYFETAGYRGIVHEGWKAVAQHEPGDDFAADAWALYDLAADPAETVDLAARHPERVADLVRRWWAAAEAYDVLPLDDRMTTRGQGRDPDADRRHYVLLPGTRLLNPVSGPDLAARAVRVRAHVLAREPGQSGVLLGHGRCAYGFALAVTGDRLRFDLDLAGEAYALEAPLRPGAAVLGLDLDDPGDGPRARLLVDGEPVATGALSRLLPGGMGTLSTQCGHHDPSPVGDHVAPATFAGVLDRVEITLGARAGPAGAAPAGAVLLDQ